MNSWARKSVKVGVLSAGFLLAGTAAQAADTTSNNAGILNGTQVDAMVQAPIDVCGNAIAVLGSANAGCTGGAWATFNGELGDLVSTNNFGLANGTQVRAFVQAPIDVCGNGVGVLGTASAWCTGGSWATHNPGKGHGHGPKGHGPKHHGDYYVQESRTESASTEGYGGHGGAGGGTSVTTTNNAGILNGTQVYAPIQVPINVCGNAIAILGAHSTAGCQGGAHASLSEGALPDAWTGFNFGIGNGTQILPILQIPVNVCGNAVGVLADASASCQGGADATIGGGAPSGHGPGHGSYGDPKPMGKPAHKPARKPGKKGSTEGLPLVGELPLVGGLAGLTDTVTGLADNLVGSAAKSQVNGGGLLGGVTGLGMGAAPMDAGSAMILPIVDRHGGMGHGMGGDGQCLSATTSGNFGILNGTQVVAVAQAPIDISGNAIGVAGDANAYSTGGAVATLNC
jgi:hypothetical protein